VSGDFYTVSAKIKNLNSFNITASITPEIDDCFSINATQLESFTVPANTVAFALNFTVSAV
jgi:hypothetical protein